MDDFELVGPTGVNINDFLKNYRDALTNQYGSNVSALNQSKRNTEAQIMSNFNRRGTMYSNFPQREKIKNEANYLNNLANVHTTYQTGLDKLRNNAVDTYNSIKSIEEQIADLNDYIAKKTSDSTNSTTGGTDDDTDTDKDTDTGNSNSSNKNITVFNGTTSNSNTANKNQVSYKDAYNFLRKQKMFGWLPEYEKFISKGK